MNRYRTFLLPIVLAGLCALASCQPSYYYHFPKESELHGLSTDSVKWKYVSNSIVQIPVADDGGKLYWLDVTDKTKLLIKSILGEEYRFYLRSIVVANADAGLFGATAQWTGYDLHDHSHRVIMAREINTVTVIAESPATHPIVR